MEQQKRNSSKNCDRFLISKVDFSFLIFQRNEQFTEKFNPFFFGLFEFVDTLSAMFLFFLFRLSSKKSIDLVF